MSFVRVKVQSLLPGVLFRKVKYPTRRVDLCPALDCYSPKDEPLHNDSAHTFLRIIRRKRLEHAAALVYQT